MGGFYNSTPWVIPEAPQEIQMLFKRYGHNVSIKRGVFVCSHERRSTPCTLDEIIYVDSGLLVQGYLTGNVNKPHAFSLILEKRVLNYTSYLGFLPRQENIMTKHRSDLYILKHQELACLLQADVQLKDQMLKYCIACVATDYDAFTCMFCNSVEKRLVYFFQSLIHSFHSPCCSDWFEIPLKLSYKDISEIVYSSTKMIERLIPLWIDQGSIQVTRQTIKVHSRLFDIIKTL